MTDITKCTGKGCPLKEACYRFTAKAGGRQSWFVNIPYDKARKKCAEYWKINK